MLKNIVKMLLRFPENCIFVKIVTFGARQLLEQPKYSHPWSIVIYSLTPLGGYLVQKTLWGCATNMGSKISLLVYEWPLVKCRIWYMNGSIFKIGSNLRKFRKKLVILFKIWPKIAADWYINGLLFLEKLVFVMGLLSNSVAAHPYQNQAWVPPRDTHDRKIVYISTWDDYYYVRFQ